MIHKLKVFLQNILKKSSYGRKVYPKLQKAWRSFVIPIRRKRLHRCGYEAFARLHNFFMEKGVAYYCEAGTLLGVIRDKGFIKHDDDIDICIPPDSVPLNEVLRLLLDAGYKFVQCLKYDDKISEFTVRDRTGILIDVFTYRVSDLEPTKMYEMFPRWYPNRDYPNERANNILEFEYVRPTSLINVEVHGITVTIPKNYEEVLDSEFGPWRVPDPTFKSEMLTHRELPGFCYRIDLDEALKCEI